MRHKSDSRRRCILDAAIDLFREVGFERVSMAQISARVGGSKATLYSYFPSKEELFAEAMIDAMEEQGQSIIDLLDPTEPDVRNVLMRFGQAYLEFLSTSEALCCVRTAIGTNGKLGATLYTLGPKRGWDDIADYIAAVMERGNLPKGDHKMAALHLRGMLETSGIFPMLFGAEPEMDMPASVHGAVDAFLRAYG